MREIGALRCRTRGIRVVPEIDIPGHARRRFAAYPELMSAPGAAAMERHWGVLKPVLDPTKEATYTFADAMVSELAAIFPIHICILAMRLTTASGKANAAIQKFMREQ